MTSFAREKNRQNLKSILEAASTGDLEKIRALKESKINLKMRDTSGNTALNCAVRGGHQTVVDFLVKNTEHDVAETSEALIIACRSENLASVNSLLVAKADPYRMLKHAGHFFTALSFTASTKTYNTEIFKRLLNYRDPPDTNALNLALMYCVQTGDRGRVEMLLEKKADPRVQNLYAESALTYAKQLPDKSILQLLQKNFPHADKDLEINEQLVQTVRRGIPVEVQKLLAAKADPNARGLTGRGVLVHAAHNLNRPVMAELLKYHVTPTQKNLALGVVIKKAISAEVDYEIYTGAVELLLKAGADANAQLGKQTAYQLAQKIWKKKLQEDILNCLIKFAAPASKSEEKIVVAEDKEISSVSMPQVSAVGSALRLAFDPDALTQQFTTRVMADRKELSDQKSLSLRRDEDEEESSVYSLAEPLRRDLSVDRSPQQQLMRSTVNLFLTAEEEFKKNDFSAYPPLLKNLLKNNSPLAGQFYFELVIHLGAKNLDKENLGSQVDNTVFKRIFERMQKRIPGWQSLENIFDKIIYNLENAIDKYVSAINFEDCLDKFYAAIADLNFLGRLEFYSVKFYKQQFLAHFYAALCEQRLELDYSYTANSARQYLRKYQEIVPQETSEFMAVVQNFNIYFPKKNIVAESKDKEKTRAEAREKMALSLKADFKGSDIERYAELLEVENLLESLREPKMSSLSQTCYMNLIFYANKFVAAHVQAYGQCPKEERLKKTTEIFQSLGSISNYIKLLEQADYDTDEFTRHQADYLYYKARLLIYTKNYQYVERIFEQALTLYNVVGNSKHPNAAWYRAKNFRVPEYERVKREAVIKSQKKNIKNLVEIIKAQQAAALYFLANNTIDIARIHWNFSRQTMDKLIKDLNSVSIQNVWFQETERSELFHRLVSTDGQIESQIIVSPRKKENLALRELLLPQSLKEAQLFDFMEFIDRDEQKKIPQKGASWQPKIKYSDIYHSSNGFRELDAVLKTLGGILSQEQRRAILKRLTEKDASTPPIDDEELADITVALVGLAKVKNFPSMTKIVFEILRKIINCNPVSDPVEYRNLAKELFLEVHHQPHYIKMQVIRKMVVPKKRPISDADLYQVIDDFVEKHSFDPTVSDSCDDLVEILQNFGVLNKEQLIAVLNQLTAPGITAPVINLEQLPGIAEQMIGPVNKTHNPKIVVRLLGILSNFIRVLPSPKYKYEEMYLASQGFTQLDVVLRTLGGNLDETQLAAILRRLTEKSAYVERGELEDIVFMLIGPGKVILYPEITERVFDILSNLIDCDDATDSEKYRELVEALFLEVHHQPNHPLSFLAIQKKRSQGFPLLRPILSTLGGSLTKAELTAILRRLMDKDSVAREELSSITTALLGTPPEAEIIAEPSLSLMDPAGKPEKYLERAKRFHQRVYRLLQELIKCDPLKDPEVYDNIVEALSRASPQIIRFVSSADYLLPDAKSDKHQHISRRQLRQLRDILKSVDGVLSDEEFSGILYRLTEKGSDVSPIDDEELSDITARLAGITKKKESPRMVGRVFRFLRDLLKYDPSADPEGYGEALERLAAAIKASMPEDYLLPDANSVKHQHISRQQLRQLRDILKSLEGVLAGGDFARILYRLTEKGGDVALIDEEELADITVGLLGFANMKEYPKMASQVFRFLRNLLKYDPSADPEDYDEALERLDAAIRGSLPALVQKPEMEDAGREMVSVSSSRPSLQPFSSLAEEELSDDERLAETKEDRPAEDKVSLASRLEPQLELGDSLPLVKAASSQNFTFYYPVEILRSAIKPKAFTPLTSKEELTQLAEIYFSRRGGCLPVSLLTEHSFLSTVIYLGSTDEGLLADCTFFTEIIRQRLAACSIIASPFDPSLVENRRKKKRIEFGFNKLKGDPRQFAKIKMVKGDNPKKLKFIYSDGFCLHFRPPTAKPSKASNKLNCLVQTTVVVQQLGKEYEFYYKFEYDVNWDGVLEEIFASQKLVSLWEKFSDLPESESLPQEEMNREQMRDWLSQRLVEAFTENMSHFNPVPVPALTSASVKALSPVSRPEAVRAVVALGLFFTGKPERKKTARERNPFLSSLFQTLPFKSRAAADAKKEAKQITATSGQNPVSLSAPLEAGPSTPVAASGIRGILRTDGKAVGKPQQMLRYNMFVDARLIQTANLELDESQAEYALVSRDNLPERARDFIAEIIQEIPEEESSKFTAR